MLATQSCPTLCDPMDCSPPGSSVHGIFQARILAWVAMSLPRGSSRLRDWTRVSYVSYIGKRVFITSAEKPIIIVTFFFIIYVIYLGLHRIFASCCARAFSCRGFSCCGARAQYLRCMGLVTLRHVESLQTRDWTLVSCIGGATLLIPEPPGEAPYYYNYYGHGLK